MQEEQNRQIHRHPGHIEKCQRAIASYKLPQFDEVLKGALRCRPRTAQIRLKAGIEHAGAERSVQSNANAHQQARPGPFRKCHDAKQEQRDQRHKDQSELAATDQHPVVYLEHVQRGGQHQQVGDHAEQAHNQELVLEKAQCARELTAREKTECLHGRFRIV